MTTNNQPPYPLSITQRTSDYRSIGLEDFSVFYRKLGQRHAEWLELTQRFPGTGA